MKIHQVIETLAESGLAKTTLARLIETLVTEDTENRISQIKRSLPEHIERLARKHGVIDELIDYRDNERIAQLELNREFPYVEYSDSLIP